MTPPPSPSLRTIAEVERDTGLGKDTLRVWERRYGFPTPVRDARGERLYSGADVERLRLIRQLMLAGGRPGQLVPLPPEALRARLQALQGAAPRPPAADGALQRQALAALAAHDGPALRALLQSEAARRPPEALATELMAPLTAAVGQAWAAGQLAVHQEHLFTEIAQGVLRQRLADCGPPGPGRPRVLLTTLPGETHGLGLLMVELVCAAAGAGCINLGIQTPVEEIVGAAQRHGADVVGLSITGCLPTRSWQAACRQLRQGLPAPVALWLGGAAGGRTPRRATPGVRHFGALTQVTDAVREWRPVIGSSPSSP